MKKNRKIRILDLWYSSLPRVQTSITQRSFAFYEPTMWNRNRLLSALPDNSLSHWIRSRLKAYFSNSDEYHRPPGVVVVAFQWFWRRIQNDLLTYLLSQLCVARCLCVWFDNCVKSGAMFFSTHFPHFYFAISYNTLLCHHWP